MSSTDPRLVRSRNKLLDGATALLVEGGADAVTVDAVSERSGVAKSTLYRHFPSRDDLLVEVLRHNMPQLEVDLDDCDFETGLRRWLREAYLSLMDPQWARILPALMALKLTVPDIDELTEADRSVNLESLETVLERGRAEGLLDADAEVDTVISLLVGPLLFAVLNDRADELPDLAEEVAVRFVASCRSTTDR